MDEKLILDSIRRARAEGREALTELEGLGLLAAMGLETPRFSFVKSSSEILGLELFPGDKAVVKVISPEILHKTEVGGVAIVPNEAEAIAAAVAAMEGKFAGIRVDGYTVNEFIPHEAALGHELILGFRFTRDFGPVISFGPGGIYTEFLSSAFKSGVASVFFSPLVSDRPVIEAALSRNAIVALVSGHLRGTRPAIDASRIADAVEAFLRAAPALAAMGLLEFEVNPLVVAGGGRLVALDVLVKIGESSGLSANSGLSDSSGELSVVGGRLVNPRQACRPVDKIARLLRPASAALSGVSAKGVNNGRVILRNLLANGFDRERLYVVKRGASEIDGCRCFPDFASLPEAVDLAVLAIPAAATVLAIAEIAQTAKAETVVAIAGGLEEKKGTEAMTGRMRAAIAASRERPDRGPLINGGNCLGLRSVVGKYNTLFIPENKLPMPKGRVEPIALVSQSGAFVVSRISKHADINPMYMITCGNQMDLTVGDYLEHFAEDPGIEIFAAYVEGFKPLDGEKALRAARRIAASGRSLILYRGGRTAAGSRASASHTASIAGDWPVTQALFSQAGATVVDSLEDFDDALALFASLRGKAAAGPRLGALSNAGFECVAIADGLGAFELAPLAPETKPALEAIFKAARIEELVDVHNPVDLTPGAGNGAYYQSFRAILEDPTVDIGIVGIVPFTKAMNTLAAGPDSDGEDILREDSLVPLYGRLMAETTKPWVAVVDAGPLYDPLARGLASRGVAVFRTADRALKILNLWYKSRAHRNLTGA
jgi:acyl-CoA synthetase (NDP forming)